MMRLPFKKNAQQASWGDLSDLQLVSLYRETENQHYLAELFKRYSPYILTICMHYFKEESASRDATVEIYLKLVETVQEKEFENTSKLKNWMAVITKNHCISAIRRSKTQRHVLQHLEQEASQTHFVESPQPGRSMDDISPGELKEALGGLSDGQRRCIELFFFDSYQITDAVLSELKSDGISEGVLGKLRQIQNQEIFGDGFFYDRLTTLLGEGRQSIPQIMKRAFFSEKRSYRDIGQETGFTYNEVKSHIQTGRINLRKRLSVLMKKKEARFAESIR